jgi:hypothetical protein
MYHEFLAHMQMFSRQSTLNAPRHKTVAFAPWHAYLRLVDLEYPLPPTVDVTYTDIGSTCTTSG